MEEQKGYVNDKKNKFQKLLIYIFLAIFIVLVGLLIFLIINKPNNTNKNEDIKEEINKEEVNNNENVHVSKDKEFFENIINNLINVDYLEKGFNNIDELSNQEKLQILFYANNSYLENFTKEEVDIFFKNNFNTTINHEDVLCLEPSDYCYLYDIENEKYLENFINVTKEEVLSYYNNRVILNKTIDYNENDNIYKLTQLKLFIPKCTNDCNQNTMYFSNVSDANNLNNPLIRISNNYDLDNIISYNQNKTYELDFDVNYEIYKPLMVEHIYEFKNIDNNFVLTQYSINRLD